MPAGFGTRAAVGVLGGMIGLGGAELRLPELISLFGFTTLSTVILNKAMSLVVVLLARHDPATDAHGHFGDRSLVST